MTTIADKLRKASGDFRGEPPQLMHKKSVLDRRLDHAEDLASRRGGIGINSGVELRKILRQIEGEARSQLEATKIDQQAFDRLCARVEAIRSKLARAEDARAKKLNARNEERARLEVSATPPFPAPPGYKWQLDVVDGKVDWWFVSPVRFHLVIKKKEKFDGTKRLPSAIATVPAA